MWKTHFLLSKVISLKLCPLAILMPLEENPYIVPHFKALISGQKLWGGQRCSSTLSFWNALLKISILLHMEASDWFILSTSVIETQNVEIFLKWGISLRCPYFPKILNKFLDDVISINWCEKPFHNKFTRKKTKNFEIRQFW